MLGKTLLFLAGFSVFPAFSTHDRAPKSTRTIAGKLKEAAKRLNEGIKLGPNTTVRVGGKYPVGITHNIGTHITMIAGAGYIMRRGASVGVSIQIKTN